MTVFTKIPKQVEEVMEKWNGSTSRRNFLKGSGLLVVSFGAAMANVNPLSPWARAEAAAAAQAAGPYPDLTLGNSIRGSSFMRTVRRPSTSGRRTVARVPERPSGR